MKLSQLKGEALIEAIANIIEPASAIASDPLAKELMEKRSLPEGQSAAEFTKARIVKCLPGLLKNHKAEIITVLAAVDGVTPEEYAEGLNLVKLMRDATELLSDEEFMAFFS